LARAERDGAAPGTEFRGLDVAALPAFRRARAAWRPRVFATLALVFAAVAAWHAGQAGWLHAKAAVGQRLLLRAWDATRATGEASRPWPWADTHPVARLRVPGQGIDLLVLEGANGRTLAWGPGHVEGTAAPGDPGNAIVTGHRDTHFRFLRDVKRGDPLVVETPDGATRRYRVERTLVADRKALRLPADERATTLALVTCYPFDAVDPRTPLRYAVVARAEPEVRRIATVEAAPRDR
jgi:sortase A